MPEVSTSGDTTDTSGSVKEQTSQEKEANAAATSGAADGSIPNAHLEKVLKESRNKTAKIAELEAMINNIADEKLTTQQQFKELADKRLLEIKALTATTEAHKEQVEKARKISEVKRHLVALGMNPQYEDMVLNKLLDVKDLMIDPDTNAVLGAEEKAQWVRQEYGPLNLFNHSTSRVDQSAPVGQTTKKAISELTKEEVIAQLKALG